MGGGRTVHSLKGTAEGVNGFKAQHFRNLRDSDICTHQLDGFFKPDVLIISTQRHPHFRGKNLCNVGITISNVATNVLYTMQLEDVTFHVVDDIVNQTAFSAGVFADLLAQTASSHG